MLILVTSIFVVGVILIGLSFESKMQIVLMIVLYATIFDYVIGTLLTPSEYKALRGITGYKCNIFNN